MNPFYFNALQPLGYVVFLQEGTLQMTSSDIKSGEFKDGRIALPNTAVLTPSLSRVIADYASMLVQDDLDLFSDSVVIHPISCGENCRIFVPKPFYQIAISFNYFYLAGEIRDHPYFPPNARFAIRTAESDADN